MTTRNRSPWVHHPSRIVFRQLQLKAKWLKEDVEYFRNEAADREEKAGKILKQIEEMERKEKERHRWNGNREIRVRK